MTTSDEPNHVLKGFYAVYGPAQTAADDRLIRARKLSLAIEDATAAGDLVLAAQLREQAAQEHLEDDAAAAAEHGQLLVAQQKVLDAVSQEPDGATGTARA